MKYGMTESFALMSMLIFGVVTKSSITRMFKCNSGEPYAEKLHVRFLEEFISNCLIIRGGENLLMKCRLMNKHTQVALIEYNEDVQAITNIYEITNIEYAH